MLKSTHLYLGPIKADDLPLLLEWVNDREQVLLNAPYKPIAEARHREWFAAIQRRNDAFIFGIRLRDANKLIGSCQLHSISHVHRSAELQIRLGDVEERGRGYGTEAVRLLLDFAFKDLNLHRIYLNVLGTNSRAIRVYEKIGFVREGVGREAAHIDGRYVDIIQMGMLADEYVAE
jgi:RimJ/RimL family protein N-acetyltransferase